MAEATASAKPTRSFYTSNDGANFLGTSGADAVWGTSGTSQQMRGGAGDDTYYVKSWGNVPVEVAGQGVDTVNTWMTYTLGANIENLTVSGSNLKATGNTLANVIKGGAGVQTINGMSGNDVLSGGADADTFVVAKGNGSDIITDFATSSGGDTLRLSGFSFANVAAVKAAATQVGGDTVVPLGGGETLTFKGLSLTAFQSATITLEGTVAPQPPPPLHVGSAPVGKQTLTVDYGDVVLETFTYRPAGEINGVMLNFHGMGRNASGARDASVEFADEHGFYVVSPVFDESQFPSSMYQLGGIVSGGKMLPQDDWTVSLVDDIASWAHAQVGNDPNDETIAFGHSAGGQFLSRVAAFGPDIFDKMIIANPSTHVRASLTEDAPYGFDGYLSSAQEEAMLRDYLADPVTIYLGANDNNPNDPELSRSAAAMRQGDDRLERGQFVYNEAEKLAASQGWEFNWELVIADDVGHSSWGMLNAPEFEQAFDGRYLESSNEFSV